MNKFLSVHKEAMCKLYNISDNPFARFSAEEEEDLKSIFYKPRYYDALKSNAKQGNSRILVGQRGLGKSATIHMLFEDLKANKTLPILITRYDGIPLSNNKGYFLYLIVKSLAKRIVEYLYRNPKESKLLNKEQKSKLSHLIELFYDEELAEDYLNAAKNIKAIKRSNWIRRIFNKNLRLINNVVSGMVQITASVIRQSSDLPEIDRQSTFCQFFEELSIEEIKGMSMSEFVSGGDERLLGLMNILIDIALSLKYESIVILFDKIDEWADVNSDINKVADFTLPILTDTDLLYTKKLSIVFSLWSEVKRTLNNKGVRFDKFQDIDISWRDIELEQLIDKRLSYYSVDKGDSMTLKSLVRNDNDRKDILRLADGAPRSRISLLSRIYDEEKCYGPSESISSFSSNAISRGVIEFCKRFDYEALRPSKVSDKSNYYNWLNKVLLMKKPDFTLSEVCSVFNIKMSAASKYVLEMERLGIVTLDSMGDDEDTIYRTVDPRIQFLMSRGVTKLS